MKRRINIRNKSDIKRFEHRYERHMKQQLKSLLNDEKPKDNEYEIVIR